MATCQGRCDSDTGNMYVQYSWLVHHIGKAGWCWRSFVHDSSPSRSINRLTLYEPVSASSYNTKNTRSHTQKGFAQRRKGDIRFTVTRFRDPYRPHEYENNRFNKYLKAIENHIISVISATDVRTSTQLGYSVGPRFSNERPRLFSSTFLLRLGFPVLRDKKLKATFSSRRRENSPSEADSFEQTKPCSRVRGVLVSSARNAESRLTRSMCYRHSADQPPPEVSELHLRRNIAHRHKLYHYNIFVRCRCSCIPYYIYFHP